MTTTTTTTTATGTSRTGWVRRCTALMLSLVAAAALSLGFASPAAAYPGQTETQISCLPGAITISAFAAVQNGYFRGQYVSYRYYITGTNGYRGTSGWSSAVLVPYQTSGYSGGIYGTSMLPQARINAGRGVLWDARVQLAFWNGAAYSYTNWFQPPVNGSTTNFCTT